MPNLSSLPLDRRIDRSKIEDYLLHPVNGRGKAAFFGAYGFAPARWEDLRGALLEHAVSGSLVDIVVSPYGTRYIVRGRLRTPDGRAPQPVVCSVWQADAGGSGVRLITAYPNWPLQENEMFQEHAQVVLACPLPAFGLEPGDVGVVVHVHAGGAAYEVEFMSLDGRTIAVQTLQTNELRAISASAVPHERVRATA